MNHTERLAFTERIFEQCEAEPYYTHPDKYTPWLGEFDRLIVSLNRCIRENPHAPPVSRWGIQLLISHCLTLTTMVAHDTGEPVPDILGDCLHIMRTKGLSYASQADAAENFKIIAAELGLTKYQVLGVYLGKHVLSIRNSIVNAYGGVPTTADGESIFGRVNDTINYAVLLAMMVQDDEKATAGFTPEAVPEYINKQ